MMEDPKRLLSAHGGAMDLERELLESVPNIAPPAGAKDRAWEALALQLGAAALVSAGAGTAKAATAATQASIGKGLVGTKLLAIVIASGITAGGGIWALSPAPDVGGNTSQQTAARYGASEPGVKREIAGAHPEDEAAVEEQSPNDAGTSRRQKKNKLSPRDSLLRESALLKQARAELQAGNSKAAQASLERLASEFPEGVLGQEREVLAIGVLSAQGQVKRAQQRARAFVKAYPQSPHNASLRELLESP